MPFDGIVTKCVVNELSSMLVGGRIEKISQPEIDEICLFIHINGKTQKLLLCSNPNYPRIHITETIKDNPSVPPIFTVVLRKHFANGRILDFACDDYERIVRIDVKTTNELGDSSIKSIIIEIMGRHSNIILLNEQNKIIDSIKHIDKEINRVREVMPARNYELPPQQEKPSVDYFNINNFISNISSSESISLDKYIQNNIKGFGLPICKDLCLSAGIEPNTSISLVSVAKLQKLSDELQSCVNIIKNNSFSPCIIFLDEEQSNPIDFYCLSIKMLGNVKYYNSMSEVLDKFYSAKTFFESQKQKKADISKILNICLDRCKKKLSIHENALRDVANRDDLKLYGELITANIHQIPKQSSSVNLVNYYCENSETINIPLDENLSASANAQKYFKKYNKAKRTFLNTNTQLKITQNEFEYLESVRTMLDKCHEPAEINEIREELSEQGYLHLNKKQKIKRAISSKPHHYLSSDGFDIYVGKNNIQNDLLTLKSSRPNDLWLHTKDTPGSHVIINKKQNEISNIAIEEAAVIAAYHSKASNSSKVPVDYTIVKNVKKPTGAKPGKVIYNNYKTIVVNPERSLVEKLKVKYDNSKNK